ncbi:MAG TPA: SRPBCC domain-containing protein [Chlorobaculum sp.]|nr:SRPBCC domain-containing protein [Chlorobaculum sp.]
MKAFRTEVSIHASQEHVWSILSDFGSYPSWNPFILHVNGQVGQKEKLRLTVKLSVFPPVSFNAAIDRLVPGERIGWNAVFLNGLMNARHWFELYRLDSGGTRLVHCEEFTGVLSGPVLAILSGSFNKGYGLMNLALKKESERR